MLQKDLLAQLENQATLLTVYAENLPTAYADAIFTLYDNQDNIILENISTIPQTVKVVPYASYRLQTSHGDMSYFVTPVQMENVSFTGAATDYVKFTCGIGQAILTVTITR